MRHLILVLGMALLAGTARAGAESEWQLSNDADGILTYKRRTPGSSFMSLRGITVVDARMETLGQVLRDVLAYPEWMHMCKGATVINKIDDDNMTVHVVMKFPVVSKRDLVVKAETIRDLSKARGIVSLSMPKDSSVPSPTGAVRMRDFSGQFIFEYLTREKTGVVYTYHADPGGSIPSFVANIVAKSIIHRTLSNLKKAVNETKYIEAGKQSRDREQFEDILSDTERVKAILKARMMEYYRDSEFVDAVVADQAVFDLFVNGDGKIAQQVFMSWGSRENLENGLRAVLAIHARKYTLDDKAVAAIGNDKALIKAVLDGKKEDQQSAMELLRSHLPHAP